MRYIVKSKRLSCLLLSVLISISTATSNSATACAAESTAAVYSLTFAGDINLDESWSTTQALDARGGRIENCISADLLATMQTADVMCLNNEFTYSTRGKAMTGKAYTFRANPARVSVLQTMGVDVAGLANNHVYDYGADALIDTLDTLDAAGIAHVGAGRNLAEAIKPCYVQLNGYTIAYVAASRAEKTKLTPQATDTQPGILRCYDTALFCQAIAEARQHADYVVALVHWGTEYSTKLEQVQRDTARLYINSGADAIIGAHSHCLQGLEYYAGKPIVYSLGNYWFNEKTLDTMLVTIDAGPGYTPTLRITPALQANCTTVGLTDPSQQRAFYDRLEAISVNVSIDDNGYVTAK